MVRRSSIKPLLIPAFIAAYSHWDGKPRFILYVNARKQAGNLPEKKLCESVPSSCLTTATQGVFSGTLFVLWV
jgi:hypothetical protein